jgi:hypothetical protein
MKIGLFIAGFLLLLLTEIARVYFIMPFPGSQQSDTIELAYAIQSNLGLIRMLGVILIAYPLYLVFTRGSKRMKLAVGTLLVVYIVIFYMFNFRFLAEKMFYQPRNKVLASVANNKVGGKQLVLGVFLNGEAKAYPIEIIGYHHQVRDVLGGEQIMVTYCTVCRTGRVFSPVVDGQLENFRLVGMDHFNAMFEDGQTHSWWRQVNGEAIAGPLKGKSLPEIPAEQMSLDAWVRQHPGTLILQQDKLFLGEYEGLKNYDEGKSKGGLTRADSLPWQNKSWVVGVPMGMYARAYDWHDLVNQRVINDKLAGTPVVVVLENDTASFHVWERMAGKDTLDFVYNEGLKAVMDRNTNSVWSWSGDCLEGKLKGTHLRGIQSYQEFWHSWKTFHPQTTQYKISKGI